MSGQLSSKNKRPLSPHLQIYKPQITSVLSFLHRATGVALCFGIPFFVWWIAAAASGSCAYDFFIKLCASPIGIFCLFGWTVCFYYYLANGIRHLLWDAGALLEIKNVYISGYLVLFFTALLTVGSWGFIFF
ncbi:MAG: succinate dehydrogenase, cytochrome b556 subunit [Alphaproteobacteria bacterium]|nr:succinate dehydrogenase, cytochrome b556 subunit [Alphaproteobacteria bacterium]